MNLFQNQLEEVGRLVKYESFPLLTKRLIDFTLDTGQIALYRKMVELLDWIDANPDQTEDKKAKFSLFLDELSGVWSKKSEGVEESSLLLTVDNLVTTYKKSAFALGPVSFEVRQRQIIGLVGENGNGKTTLLRSLCGELQPVSGKMDYLFPYTDRYDLRSKLIYIPQRTPSWHGSLLSNLRFTAASYGLYGEENLLTVELIVARMGLRQFRSYKWKDLSSGYKMRFELARALLRKPRLLLIDEPLANLDILAQQIVLDDLHDIASSPLRPMGIVLSSQQLYEVEKTSDFVLFLKNGKPINSPQDTNVAYVEVPKLIIEFESDWDQERLRGALEALQPESLQINGGTYVACFPDTVTQEDFLKIITEQKIPMTYFRDISRSSRRFFLS